MDVNVTLIGDRQLVQRLEAMPQKLRALLRREVRSATLKVLARSKQLVSGQVLKVQTGLLRRSINDQYDEGDHELKGIVGTNKRTVPYAAIHEFGGTTKPHVIDARRAKVLRFQMGGETVFRRKVNHPGSTMPERSYLRRALRELAPDIRTQLTKAVVESVKP